MFKPGKSGNIKGKPKGATNRNSRELKTIISRFVERRFKQIEDEFDKLSPSQKSRLLVDLLPYVVTKATPEDENKGQFKSLMELAKYAAEQERN